MQKTGFVWGNGRTYEIGRIFFSGFRKAPYDQICSGAPYATNDVPEKNKQKSSSRRKRKKSVSKHFNFYKNDYRFAQSTKFLARSIFSSSNNFGLPMTNDVALKL